MTPKTEVKLQPTFNIYQLTINSKLNKNILSFYYLLPNYQMLVKSSKLTSINLNQQYNTLAG